MSFVKRTRLPDIPGVRPSLNNGQPLTSSGNPSLDYILGGGVQVGTVLLVEEDKYAGYSNVLTRYFLAEGVVNKHGLYLATLDEDPKALIEKLPSPVADTGLSDRDRPVAPIPISSDPNEDMKIAWRYNNLPKVNSVEETSNTNKGHFFDLSTTIDSKLLEETSISLWRGVESSSEKLSTTPRFGLKNEKLQSCLVHMYQAAEKYKPESCRNLLRIALSSIGSPYWYEKDFFKDFYKFLTLLKALVRHTTVVCLITVPTHLFNYIDENAILKVRSLVDTTIELQSFAGSEKETNPFFKDYHGLLYIRHTKAVNCPVPYYHKITDLAFKLRRRKFVIEKLHLPPELQETDQREQDEIVPGMACSATKKHLLEF